MIADKRASCGVRPPAGATARAILGALALALIYAVPVARAYVLPPEGIAAYTLLDIGLAPLLDRQSGSELLADAAVPGDDAAELVLEDAVQENAAIKDMLRTLLPAFIPLAPERGFQEPGDLLKSADRGAAPAADEAPGAERRKTAGARGFELDADAADDGGLTAGTVLRALASKRRGKDGDNGTALDAEELDAGDDAGPSLSGLILDSRFLGAMLESAITYDSADDTFSVFGLGRFELGLDPDDTTLTITETTSNVSLTLDISDRSNGGGRPDAPGGPKITEKDIIDRILGYAESPTGILVEILAATVLLLWTTIRVATRR